jgi:hypothetical protein
VDLEAAQERAPHLAVAPVGSTEPEEEYRAAAAVRVHSNGHTPQSMPVAGIVEELRRCCGTQFDPLVVEAAIHVLRASDPPPVGPVAEPNASPEEHIVSGVSHPVEIPE